MHGARANVIMRRERAHPARVLAQAPLQKVRRLQRAAWKSIQVNRKGT